MTRAPVPKDQQSQHDRIKKQIFTFTLGHVASTLFPHYLNSIKGYIPQKWPCFQSHSKKDFDNNI